jgi:hypothetical protein
MTGKHPCQKSMEKCPMESVAIAWREARSDNVGSMQVAHCKSLRKHHSVSIRSLIPPNNRLLAGLGAKNKGPAAASVARELFPACQKSIERCATIAEECLPQSRESAEASCEQDARAAIHHVSGDQSLYSSCRRTHA